VRIVQISDTHLSHQGGITNANFKGIVTFVNEALRPDLVVNTGDVVAASPDEPGDRETARDLHSLFDAPVRIVPGNHDVGEPGTDTWMGLQVTSARVAAYRAALGDDRFVESTSDGAAVGINSELLGSGLPEEEQQWAWLDDTLGALDGRPAVLFLHKPVWHPRRGSQARHLSIPVTARRRLIALDGFRSVRAIGSGHLHRFRRRVRPGLLEVWAPSTGFVGQTKTATTYFEQLGVVEWLVGQGGVQAWFRAPVDLCEREGEDIPELVATVERLRSSAGQDGR